MVANGHDYVNELGSTGRIGTIGSIGRRMACPEVSTHTCPFQISIIPSSSPISAQYRAGVQPPLPSGSSTFGSSGSSEDSSSGSSGVSGSPAPTFSPTSGCGGRFWFGSWFRSGFGLGFWFGARSGRRSRAIYRNGITGLRHHRFWFGSGFGNWFGFWFGGSHDSRNHRLGSVRVDVGPFETILPGLRGVNRVLGSEDLSVGRRTKKRRVLGN